MKVTVPLAALASVLAIPPIAVPTPATNECTIANVSYWTVAECYTWAPPDCGTCCREFHKAMEVRTITAGNLYHGYYNENKHFTSVAKHCEGPACVNDGVLQCSHYVVEKIGIGTCE